MASEAITACRPHQYSGELQIDRTTLVGTFATFIELSSQLKSRSTLAYPHLPATHAANDRFGEEQTFTTDEIVSTSR